MPDRAKTAEKAADGGRDQREHVRRDPDQRARDQHQPMPSPVGEEAEDEVARNLAREEHAGERGHPPGGRLPGPQGIYRVEAPGHGADRGEGARDEEPAQVVVAREQARGCGADRRASAAAERSWRRPAPGPGPAPRTTGPCRTRRRGSRRRSSPAAAPGRENRRCPGCRPGPRRCPGHWPLRRTDPAAWSGSPGPRCPSRPA